MASVVLENLRKTFKGPKGATIRAVQDLSLTVEEGELLALVGPSGCGKTTTLRLAAGLEEPDGGTISIDGQVINNVAPKDRDVAMVFQNHALYPHMTVFDNMAFGLKLRKVPKPERVRRVTEAAAMLELTSCLERLPKALSGGQRQRVAVGRAIVRRPKLFLFDEPLSNLDAPLRAQMRREIVQLRRQLRVSTIYVTHDQAEAMAVGDRVAVMNEGVIQHVARPLDVYHHPANLFVAGFIGSPPMNLLHGVVRPEGGRLCFRSRQTRDPRAEIAVSIDGIMVPKLIGFVDKEVVLGLRAEDIGAANAEPDGSLDSAIKATVRLVEPLGSENHFHLAAGAHAFIASWQGDPASFIGADRPVRFDMKKAHFFDPDTGKAIV